MKALKALVVRVYEFVTKVEPVLSGTAVAAGVDALLQGLGWQQAVIVAVGVWQRSRVSPAK